MIIIKSPNFQDGGMLPEKYTCNGQNVNPPLFIENKNPLSKSLFLVMEDLDTLFGFSTHWVVWNIHPDTKEIRENSFPEGAVVGMNSFKESRYCGPCPRLGGNHRYLFTVYALDATIDLPPSSSMRKLEEKLTNHLLDEGKLLVTYRHKRENSSNDFLDFV
jgi:Raf kinase inhibitor-like YbhB/YbcL family protein